MMDSQFTAFARQRLRVLQPANAVWGNGAGLRAHLSSLLEEVEQWPTPDERILQVLLWLRRVEPQAAIMTPLLVQRRVVQILEAIGAMEQPD